MIKYVTGFLFSIDAQEVVLIQKNRPEWQAGKLNGVGGKIEEGETPLNAMQREFFEETGVEIQDWEEFAIIQGPEYIVHFHCAFTDNVWDVKTNTDEEVYVFKLAHLENVNVIPNTKWLIPMALYGTHHNATITYLD